MRMENEKGETIYYNSAVKRGKLVHIIKSADGHPILSRDKAKRQSRTFVQEAQAGAWLRRNGYHAK